MTINDILCHKGMSTADFYSKLRACTISEAAKEPLKLRNLSSISPAISGTAR